MRGRNEKSWMVTGVLVWASGLWDVTGQDGEGGEEWERQQEVWEGREGS